MTKTLRGLFIFSMVSQTLIWIVFGVIFLADESYFSVTVPLLMLLNGLAFSVFCWLFITKGVLVRLIALAFIFMNLVLTVTDQMGTFDYIVFALSILASVCSITLILRGRKARDERTGQ